MATAEVPPALRIATPPWRNRARTGVDGLGKVVLLVKLYGDLELGQPVRKLGWIGGLEVDVLGHGWHPPASL